VLLSLATHYDWRSHLSYCNLIVDPITGYSKSKANKVKCSMYKSGTRSLTAPAAFGVSLVIPRPEEKPLT